MSVYLLIIIPFVRIRFTVTSHQVARFGLLSLGSQTVTRKTGWMTLVTGGMTGMKLLEKPLMHPSTLT